MSRSISALTAAVGELVEVEQRQRMDLDVGGDDEFHPRQADAVVGNEGKREGLLGIGEVHHDLRARALAGL